MDEVMAREIRRLEGRNWWFVGMRRIAAALLEHQGAGRFRRALDVGCGSGGNLELLSRFAQRTVALDLGVESLRSLGARAEAAAGDARALPFAAGAFDLVNLFNVIEHVDDDSLALREIARVLAPGGTLLLATSAHRALWSDHDEVNQHVRRYERAELARRIEGAGLVVERLTFANALLLPPTFAVAAARRLLKGLGMLPPYQRSLLDAPPVLNSALAAMLAAEAALVRAGADLPEGVSLLARVRKP